MFSETNFENRASVKKEIIRLSNLLDSKFATELNFRNHCYLRIAYDNAVNNKWDNVIAKPFIKNANEDQLNVALMLLNNYVTDKVILNNHNLLSLKFRDKTVQKSKN